MIVKSILRKINLMDGFIGKIQPGKVTFFTKNGCPFCTRAENTLQSHGVKYDLVECPGNPNFSAQIKKQLEEIAGFNTYPKVFVGKKVIGGCSETQSAISNGSFFKDLDTEGIPYKK